MRRLLPPKATSHVTLNAAKPDKLVLFVHGLGGHPFKTWGNFFALLKNDSELGPQYDVGSYSFPTALFRFPLISRRPPNIQTLARGLDTQLRHRFRHYAEINLICHSLGGLIARKYLIDVLNASGDLRVKRLVPYATPNNGAQLADLAGLMRLRHAQLAQLCRTSDFIEFLNEDWYRLGIESKVEIKYIVGGQDSVVEATSARGYWANHAVETITDRGHIDIVKPESADDLSFLILKNLLVSEATSRPARLFGWRAVRSPVVPAPDFVEQVEQHFVGRADMREELSHLTERLRERRGAVYWAHGSGGMGKSFLLRRAFLDVPLDVKKALVDWDDQTNRFRKPLQNSPATVADLFDTLAYAFHAAFGSANYDKYWSASTTVRQSEARRTLLELRFDATVEQLVKVLSQQNPEDFPQASVARSDYLETEDDLKRQAEREGLLALVSVEPKVKRVLAQLGRVQRNREAFFDHAAWEGAVERWIRSIAPNEEEHVCDPGSYLARELSTVITEHLKHEPFVLFLDTLVVLSPRLDRHLCQLLATGTNGGLPLLTIIASRFEPDSRLPDESFSGWNDTFGGGLKTRAFGRNARFTPTDVRQLIQRLSTPAPPDPELPEKIIARTLGRPMSVGAIFRMHERGDDVLSTFEGWEIIDPFLDESAATAKVIDQTASRILLHIDVRQRDEDAVRDVIFLTLGQNGWFLRLQELWWGDNTKRRDRLFQLAREVDFLDGGSIDPETKPFLRHSWARRPHRLLPNVVERSLSLMQTDFEKASLHLTSLRDWLRTDASFALWSDGFVAVQERLQAALIQLASPTFTPAESYPSDMAGVPGTESDAIPDTHIVRMHLSKLEQMYLSDRYAMIKKPLIF